MHVFLFTVLKVFKAKPLSSVSKSKIFKCEFYSILEKIF